MKWIFYLLVLGVAGFLIYQFVGKGSQGGVKDMALSWPPQNQTPDDLAAARKQLVALRHARDEFLEPKTTTSTNNSGMELTMTETSALARYVYSIRVKNPLYVEVVEAFGSAVEPIVLADEYCYYLRNIDKKNYPRPLGRIYISVVPENRPQSIAETTC